MRRLFIIILFVTLCGSSRLCADTAMPIIAYMGVPDWKTSEENFKVFSECGFTVSIYPYASQDLLIKACRAANKYGIRVMGKTQTMFNSPATAARQLKNEPGFYGYFLADEPTVPQLRELKKVIQQIKTVDTNHCFYINLLPCYNPEWIPNSTKAKNYSDYLQAFDSVSCQQISFDFYPVTKTEGIRKLWYYNLETFRNHSLATKRPFWGFVLSVPHYVYPMPTMASLRLQIYSNLAYGAQAIEYFTYWTPGTNEGYDYHDGPITREGKKTKTYTLVQAMNKELKSVSSLFYGAKVTAVNHLVTIPEGTTKLTTPPTNISRIIVSGKSGALVSQFTKNGRQYMAVVNKDLTNKITLKITASNSGVVRVNKNLTTSAMRSSYSVGAGDIIIFRLK